MEERVRNACPDVADVERLQQCASRTANRPFVMQYDEFSVRLILKRPEKSDRDENKLIT